MASSDIGPGQKVFYEPNADVVTPVKVPKRKSGKSTALETTMLMKGDTGGKILNLRNIGITLQSARLLLEEQHMQMGPLQPRAATRLHRSGTTYILSSCLLTSSSFS